MNPTIDVSNNESIVNVVVFDECDCVGVDHREIEVLSKQSIRVIDSSFDRDTFDGPHCALHRVKHRAVYVEDVLDTMRQERECRKGEVIIELG